MKTTIMFYGLMCSFVVLMGCSKPAEQENKSENHVATANVPPEASQTAQAETIQPQQTEEEEEYSEPEGGIYEQENLAANNTSEQAKDYDLKELVQQIRINPALAEVTLFRSQARINAIKTQTDAVGERVAIVSLSHPKDKNSGNFKYTLGGAFFCVMSLQEAAQYQNDDVIGIVGQIAEIGEQVNYYNDVKVTTPQIYARCTTEAVH